MQTLDRATLDRVVERLRSGLRPESIYLYGSHAYGRPHRDSDVDVLVVVGETDKPPYAREAEAYKLLRGLRVPVELRVVTRREFEEHAQWRSSIEREVKEKGVRLYPPAA